MVKIALIACILMLAACAARPPLAPIEDPKRVWCDHNQPHRPSPEALAAMGGPELDALLVHNRKGAAWCGWKP